MHGLVQLDQVTFFTQRSCTIITFFLAAKGAEAPSTLSGSSRRSEASGLWPGQCILPWLAKKALLVPLPPVSDPLRRDLDQEKAEPVFEENEDHNDAWLPSFLDEEEVEAPALLPHLRGMSVHSGHRIFQPMVILDLERNGWRLISTIKWKIHVILCCLSMGPEGRADLVRLLGFHGYGMNTVPLRKSPMVDGNDC